MKHEDFKNCPRDTGMQPGQYWKEKYGNRVGIVCHSGGGWLRLYSILDGRGIGSRSFKAGDPGKDLEQVKVGIQILE